MTLHSKADVKGAIWKNRIGGGGGGGEEKNEDEEKWRWKTTPNKQKPVIGDSGGAA